MKKYIGTITQTKGYEGTLVVSDLPHEFQIPENTKVFIGFSEKFTKPYEITQWEMKTKKALIKILNINNDKDAAKLKEYGIFLESDIYDELLETSNDQNIEEQFDFLDENENFIGKITEIWKLPANDVWLVKTEEGNLPVPAIEENIINIDYINHKVVYHIPDGLMDLLDHNNNEDE